MVNLYVCYNFNALWASVSEPHINRADVRTPHQLLHTLLEFDLHHG